MTVSNLMAGVEAEQEELTVDEQQEQQQEQEVAEIVKPEGLDESFWDEENKSLKQDDLIKAYQTEQKKALDLRKALSQKSSFKPPKEANEYSYSEDLGELLPEDGDASQMLKQTALESGLTKDQFNSFVSKLIPNLQEKGLLTFNGPELTEEEQEAQDAEYREAEIAKLGKDGKRVLQSVVNWGQGMVNKGILSKDELPVFQNMAIDAESLVVLNKIASLTGEPSIPVQTAVPEGILSRDEVDEIIRSEAYQKGDASAHAKVKAHFEAMNG